MATRKFTVEQKNALRFTNNNMLVSASAGSGKTTVMVQKILDYLEKGSITKIVVLTFTRASATDMREKLSEELSSLIRRGVPEANHYREQLRLMPFAYIGTIDSVCGQIYKRYFEVLGLSPSLEMLDNEESKSLRAIAIEEVFSERIKAGDEDFNELAELYANAKSFDGLRETVEILLNFLSAQEYPDKYLEFALQEARTPFLQSKAVCDAIAEIKKNFALLEEHQFNLEKELKNLQLEPKNSNASWKKLNELSDIRSRVANCRKEDFCQTISELKISVNMPNSPKEDGEYAVFHKRLGFLNAKIKNLLTKAKDMFGKSLEECEKEDVLGQKLVVKLIQIVKEIRQKHAEYKKEENKSDFEDVERNVLHIFENETICREFSESIDYVFLDEYQDTNRLQEAIFKKVARHNRFLVGDLKQAIYGFREADPDIIREMSELFTAGVEGENALLSKNFRSDQKVLTFVDNVFSEVMTKDFGGVDYRGLTPFGEAGLPEGTNGDSPVVEVAVFTPNERNRGEADTEIYSVKNGKRENKKEKYADLYIADRIEAMVGKESLNDRKEGTRPIRYGDICVLYRTKTHVNMLKKIFDERGIPYVAEGMEGQSGSRDVDAINCYLRTIDNFMQDKYLVGAMLSYVGGFNESELAEIRKYDYDSEFFHEAVVNYVKNNEGALKDKIEVFFQKVNEYKKLSNLVDVPTLIGNITTDTGYLSALLAEGKTARIALYNAFIQTLRTKKFAKSLQSYLEFLNSGVQMEIPSPTIPGDAVTIMTVHRSKGLEFPVVFVARADTTLNRKSGKQPLVLDSSYGIGINVFNDEEGSSNKSTRRLAIEKAVYLKQNLEALRLMYVAFTRARYRLYVVGTMNVDPYELPNPLETPSEKDSFMGWVVFASKRNPKIAISIDPNVLGQELLAKKEEGHYYKEAKPLDFALYPYQVSTTISNKYTVTAVNTQSFENEEIEKIPILGSQNIQKGVAYHKVMELIDFNLRTENEIASFIEELEETGTIERGVVKAENVLRGISHPLFDGARKGKCLREQEFIYYAPASMVVEKGKILSVEEKKALDTDRVLIQGIMDLVIEGEENIIVDYKVSGASEEVLRARYGTQVELYAKAYEEMTGKKVNKKAIFVLNRGEVIEF